MNERIRLLALEAGSYVNEVYTGPVRSKTPGKIWEDGHVGWHEQFNEKFAQLIIQDIHAYVDSMDTAQIISTGILRRYGVEL